jgi:hypothetical protein
MELEMNARSLTLFFIILCVLSAVNASAGSTFSITGVVKQPINLGIEDLARFQTVRVQLNEVMKDKSYKGAFYYNGVTLRSLLDTASIEKKVKSGSKDIDLAIKVTNREGKAVVLSWGEIYYRNSGDIIIATSAVPITPRKSCASCHKGEEAMYQPYLDVFNRKIDFPKLVVGSDGYGGRSLEGIVNIEVINPNQNTNARGNSSEKLFSPAFKITGFVKKEMTVTDLSKYSRKELTMIHMGEGKGFHGIADFSGATLKALLVDAGIENDLNSVFIVSAPDGYRSLFSYGEVFLNRADDTIIMADKKDGNAIDEEGKFILAPCDDIMSDRDVKSVEKIEVLTLK